MKPTNTKGLPRSHRFEGFWKYTNASEQAIEGYFYFDSRGHAFDCIFDDTGCPHKFYMLYSIQGNSLHITTCSKNGDKRFSNWYNFNFKGTDLHLKNAEREFVLSICKEEQIPIEFRDALSEAKPSLEILAKTPNNE